MTLADNTDSSPSLTTLKLGATTLTTTRSGNVFTVTGPTTLNAQEIASATLQAVATDALGNSRTTNLTVSIDNKAPVIGTVTSNGSAFTGGRIVDVTKLAFTVTDGTTSTPTVTAKIGTTTLTLSKSGSTYTVTGPTSLNSTELASGVLGIIASDSYDNGTSKGMSVAIDNKAPVIGNVTYNGAAFTGGRIADVAKLAFTVSDGGTTYPTVTAKIGSTTLTFNRNGTDFTVTGPTSLNSTELASETFEIVATDSYNQTASKSLDISIDNTAPSIAIKNNGAAFSGGRITDVRNLTVTLTDGTSNSPSLTTLKLGSTTLTTTRSGNVFTVTGPTTLNDQEVASATLQAVATDDLGNSRTTIRIVSVDNTAPTIAVKNDGAEFSGGRIVDVSKLTVTLADGTDASPTLTTLKLGSTTLTTTRSGNVFTVTGPTTLNDQEIDSATLQAVATDDLGNSRTTNLTVSIDNKAPVIGTVTYNGAAFTGGRIVDVTKLAFTVTDGATTTPTVTAKIGGTTLTLSKSGTTYTVTGPISLNSTEMASGTLAITATDAHSNTDSKALPVSIDNTAPAIGTVTKDGSAFTGGRVLDVTTLAFPVTDGTDTAPVVTASINDTAVTLAKSGTTYTVTGPATLNSQNFTGNMVITATDTNGNSSSKTVSVTMDNAPPVISSLKNNGIAFSGGRVADITKLTFTVSDGLDSAPAVTVTINGTVATFTRSGTTYTVTGPATLNTQQFSGNLVITATDNFSQSTTSTTGIIVDNAAPVISNIKNDGVVFTGGRVLDVTKLSFTVVDGLDATPTVTGSLNGVSLTLAKSGTTYTVTGPASLNAQQFNGSLIINASDDQGNTSGKAVSGVIVDNTGPVINNIRNNGVSFTGGRVADVTKLAFTVIDRPDASLTVTATLNGSNLTLSKTGTTYNVTGPDTLNALQFSDSLVITATDDFNQSSTSTTSVIIDNKAPVISDLKNNGAAFSGGQVVDVTKLSFTVTDGLDSNPTVTAKLNGTSLALSKTGTTYTVTGPTTLNAQQFLADLVVVATDNYGQGTTEITPGVLVDNTAPTIAVKNNGTTFTGGRIVDVASLTVTLTDGTDAAPNLTTLKLGTTTLTTTRSGNVFTITGPITLNNQELASETLQAVATDSLGNSRTLDLAISLDNAAPVIKDIIHDVAAFTGGRIVDVTKLSFTVTDGATSTPTVNAKIGTTTLTLSKSGTTYTVTGPTSLNSTELASGTLVITATDTYSNTANKSLDVSIDNRAPVIKDITYDGVAFTGGRLIDVTKLAFTVTDGADAAPTVTAKIADTALTLVRVGDIYSVTGPGSLNTTEVPPGLLEIEATDFNSNRSNKNLNVFIDNIAPVIKDVTYDGTAFTGGRIVDVTKLAFTVTDGTDAAPTVTAKIGEVFLTLERTENTYSVIGPISLNQDEIAQDIFLIESRDDNNNASNKSFDISIDNMAPAIKDVIYDGAAFTGGRIADVTKLTFTVTDATDAAPVVTAKFAGTPLTLERVEDVYSVTGPASLNTTEVPPGLLEIEATDFNSNRSNKNLNVFIDNIAPTIVVTQNGVAFTGGRIVNVANLKVTLADGTDAAPALTTLTLGNTALTTSREGNVITVTGPLDLNEQEITSSVLKVVTTDAHGNSRTLDLTISIDNTAPVIKDVTYDGAAFTGGRIVDVTKLAFTVTDGTDAAPTVTAKIADTTLTLERVGDFYSVTGPGSLNTTEIPSGLFRIDAADASGNASNKEIEAFIDNTAPTIAVKNNGTGFTGGRIIDVSSLTVTLADGTDAAPALTTLTLGDTALTTSREGNVITVTGPLDLNEQEISSAVLNVVATDAHGNSRTLDLTISIDNIAPAIEVTKAGEAFVGGQVPDLTALAVALSDGADAAPELTTFTLGGLPLTTTREGNIFSVTGPTTLNATEMNLIVVAKDAVGNTRTLTLSVDNEPPRISILNKGESFEGGTIEFFEDLEVSLEDTALVDISSISITGGPKAVDQTLGWSGTNPYAIQRPFAFPSRTENYTVTVSVTDIYQNTAAKTVIIDFAPPEVALDSKGVSADGTLYVPAMAHTFSRPDGSPALKSDNLLVDGANLLSAADIYAQMAPGSTLTLNVNEVALAPASEPTMVAGAYDFAANAAQLRLPLGASETNILGDSEILFVPMTPRAPVVVAKISTWVAEVEATTESSWEVQQIIEPVGFSLRTLPGNRCVLSSSESNAKKADPFINPVCLVEWSTPIRGLFQAKGDSPAISGRAANEVGVYPLDYAVSVIGSDGTKTILQQGQQFVDVVTPLLAYTPNSDISTVIRTLQAMEFGLEQTEGFPCELTVKEEDAIASPASGSLKCLLRWDLLPGTLAQLESTNAPAVKGKILEEGPHSVNWSVIGYTADGTPVVLTSQEHPVEVVNPPLPEVTIYSNLAQTTDGTLTHPLSAGNMGFVEVVAPVSSASITLELDGIDGGKTSTQYRGSYFGSETRISQYIFLGEKESLWDRSPITATAYYTDIPDMSVTRTVNVLRVPPERLTLTLETPIESLDTESIPVETRIGEVMREGLVQDEAAHGVWDVTLGTVTRESPFYALTEPAPMTGGLYEASLSGFDIGYVSLMAKAKITSPDGTYTREIESPRRFFAIFKGDSPDATIQSRYFSGPAPFKAILGLQMDRDSRVVLGDIVWEYSEDDGATWEAIPSDTMPWRMVMEFDVGKYLARARVTNAKSGEVGYTETIQIQAFHVPELTIDGPETALVGSQVTLTATTTHEGAPVDAVVEWRDQNQELLETGPTLTLDLTEAATYRFFVRAKMPDSPDDNPLSWNETRRYLQARPPVPPKGQIKTPYYMEAGRTYDLQALLYPPYWGMDTDIYPLAGEWTLPDGTTAVGETIQYVPSVADAEAGKVVIAYTAWIEGFRDKGTEITLYRPVRVGQYIWPEFNISQTQRIQQTPSEVILQVDPVNYTSSLESPVYTWSLPASAEIVANYGKRITARFKEAGTFDVMVHVEDARGSASDVQTQVITIPPVPFVIETKVTPSNDLYHAPLKVSLWPRTTGGHPQDRMTTFTYLLNGEEVPQTTTFGIYPDLPAGSHVLTVKGTSNFGETATTDIPLDVFENQPPVCDVAVLRVDREYNPYYGLEAACSDMDGFVAGYSWSIGEDRIGTYYKVGVPIPAAGSPPVVVDLVVRDNTGGVYTESLTLDP